MSDDRLFEIMQDQQKTLGEIQIHLGALVEGQKNASEHIRAVSQKANDIRADLDKHKDSHTAHGWGLVAMLIAIIGGAVAFFRDMVK